MGKLLIVILTATVIVGCHPKSCIIEPDIYYAPTPWQFQRMPSPFDELNEEELNEEWGKELKIGINFARELDLYRAITALKRAQVLIPKNQFERRLQIEYSIFQCYYLGKKYCEAIATYENGLLTKLSTTFPARRELLLALYDSYNKIGQEDKACHIYGILESLEEDVIEKICDSECIMSGIIPLKYEDLRNCYCCQKLSVTKAQTLNAILPGAGYYYVGQSRSAVTSFIINALFTTAAYELFSRGYIAGGLIVSSLEMGWYFGGINGAGLEAKYYNERLYNTCAKETMVENRLFPVLLFQTSF